MVNALSKADLNLLIPFQVLMRERSVTRAADKLCITQPAMSQTLNRLRQLFDDPLFVRAGQQFTPTPKACNLAAAIEPILDQLCAAILDEPFCPGTITADVKIMVPDTIAVAMTPPLFATLQRQSPNVRLLIDGFSESHLEMLANGECDFSIYQDLELGRDFVAYPLVSWKLVCWMRRGHPLDDASTVSANELSKFPIVMLTLPQRGQLHNDDAMGRTATFFKQYDLDSRASIFVSSLLVARQVIKDSDAVLIGVAFSESGPVADALVFKPIVEAQALSAPIALIQHRRTLTSALHSWMRGRIQDVWSSLGGQAPADHEQSPS